MSQEQTVRMTVDLTAEVPVPKGVNAGLSCPNSKILRTRLGEPSSSYTQQCQPPTNRTLKDAIVGANVGPFTVYGLGKAVDSLKTVMKDIKSERPAVYSALGTAGMLCCRLQRPAKGQDPSTVKAISSHSWGTAIDLTINKRLDVRGNGTAMYGMTLIAPIFNRHGWFWGATFRTEDAMHFEISVQTLSTWFPRDFYDHKLDPAPFVALRYGDRGDLVRSLQARLRELFGGIVVDGAFGRSTEAAVIKFQAAHRLKQDGIVGPVTRRSLRF